MASLQVRELPENIYYSLLKRAKEEHRSLAQEAVVILSKGLDLSVSGKERREKLLSEIKNNRVDKSVKEFKPADLLREDRDR